MTRTRLYLIITLLFVTVYSLGCEGDGANPSAIDDSNTSGACNVTFGAKEGFCSEGGTTSVCNTFLTDLKASVKGVKDQATADTLQKEFKANTKCSSSPNWADCTFPSPEKKYYVYRNNDYDTPALRAMLKTVCEADGGKHQDNM